MTMNAGKSLRTVKVGLAAAQQWFPHYDPEEFCALLKQWGSDFVEIMPGRNLPEEEDRWYKAVKDSGMELVFHFPYGKPYRMSDFNSPGIKDLYYSMFSRIVDAGKGQASIRVVQHLAAGPDDMDKGILFSITGEFLKWFYGTRAREKWPLDIVLELLPHDPRLKKVGDCIGDLVTLQELYPRYRLIFCWDMGHFRANQLMGYDGILLPSFLKSVRHVHAHDIVDDDDHYPLLTGEVPVEEYLDLLPPEDTIYIGLEIHYKNALKAGDPLAPARASIIRVIQYMQSLQEKLFIIRK